MKSKTSLRKIVENIPEAIGIPILVSDNLGNIRYANSSAEETFRDSLNNIAKKSAQELFRDIDNFSKYFKEAFSGKRILMFDISISNKEGDKIPLEFFELVSFTANGEKEPFSLISFKKKEESFVEKFIGREQWDPSSYEIVWRGIGHEIKNPLGGIKGAAQMLMKNLGENSPFKNHARVIIRETDRIARFLDGLLQTHEGTKKEHVDVLNVLTEAIELVISHVSTLGKDITIKIIADTSLPGIDGEPDALFRAFTNLLKNSVEAIEECGTVRITLKLHEDLVYEAKGKSKNFIIEMEFFDTGKKIKDEEIPFLFLPFYTNKPEGAGMGLFFVKNIIKAHGGSIRLKVFPDGKAFRVYLPLKKEEI